ncbi:MAG: transketolase [Thermoplasmataceae archaeon]
MEKLSDNKIFELSREARKLVIEMVYSAKSGHPGGSLSVIDVLAVLYFREMNIDPTNPSDPKRDRLVMSKGHASPALYSILSLGGFFPKELLTGFRKLNSKLEGHVHRGVPGVETSTGSLGQGLGIAVGMALAGKIDGESYHVYAILGDGEMEEGSIWESLMAANKFSLSNLIVVLDKNNVQLDGFTKDIMPMGDIAAKVRAFGWNVIEIDGHNINEISEALGKAKQNKNSPTFIIANTIKGKGVKYMENNPKYHGSPPADENEYKIALKNIAEMIQ